MNCCTNLGHPVHVVPIDRRARRLVLALLLEVRDA